MSHKLQIRALLGLVVVVAIAVGVLVWPAPKEARAWTNHKIIVKDSQTLLGIQGVMVRFSVKTGPNEEDWVVEPTLTAAGGTAQYSSNPDPGAEFWIAEMIDNDYELVETQVTPQDVAYPVIEYVFYVTPN